MNRIIVLMIGRTVATIQCQEEAVLNLNIQDGAEKREHLKSLERSEGNLQNFI
jgi:hypothetical protein